MKCQGTDDNEVQCDNEARYIDEFGQHMCGICPLKYGADALKADEIGELITWAREVCDGGTMGGRTFERLRRIMGPKKPEAPFLAQPELEPMTVTPEQLINDQTYATFIPGPGDGAIIGEALAARLSTPCANDNCQRPSGHEPPHMSRSWNAQWGTEEIEEW